MIEQNYVKLAAPMRKPTRGKRGVAGKRGPAGAPGAQGPAGPVGPKMKAAEVLALVDDQFVQVRKQLDIQLLRTGQLQAQLDSIQKNTNAACAALDVMHPLIKALVKDS